MTLASLLRVQPSGARAAHQTHQQQRLQKRPAPGPAAAAPLARRQRQRQQAAAAAAVGGSGGSGAAPPVKLTLNGTTVAMPQAELVVGSSSKADLQLEGEGVEAQHAKLAWRSGRLFATALTGDPEALLSPTRAWLGGVEMRPGVAYMVPPGGVLAVGTQAQTVSFDFSEGGGAGGMTEMLMKGLASGASKEVQDKLQANM